MPIINSILDTDFYKITMQKFYLDRFPDATGVFKFKNRGTQRFNKDFVKDLKEEICSMASLKLSIDESKWLYSVANYLGKSYLEYLRNYSFNPNDVIVNLTEDNDLDITIGNNSTELHKITLWEVPLMAIISELYFNTIETNWFRPDFYDKYKEKTELKAKVLYENNCNYSDFGTRRRRDFKTQLTVIDVLKDYSNFVGTSNVYFAKQFRTRQIGTVAHEVYMTMQALKGIRYSNYYALEEWEKCFDASLGTALCDTVTSDVFFKDFNLRFSKLYDGIRQDSGDIFEFADKAINHYKFHKIDPMSKTIIFSDNLNVDKVVKIKNYCKNKIKCSFGIGTNFSNNIESSKPLNMVIKLNSVNGIPVVKLSDDKGKEMGDKDMLRVTKYLLFNQSLD